MGQFRRLLRAVRATSMGRRGCALDIIERHRLRERWQVVGAHLCYGLKPGGKFNQRRLAERTPEKADAKRCAKDDSGGHLHNRVARLRGQA